MNPKKQKPEPLACDPMSLIAIKDTLQLLSGKWKIQIAGLLFRSGRMRFMDLQRGIDGIGAKMLSRELQELEENKIVSRTVMDTKPVTVEYELTPHGRTLEGVIVAISDWGVTHRNHLFKQPSV
jgi:DNA-binding HxlR family transcriptional regulator